MAKSNIRKNDPDEPTAPARRRRAVAQNSGGNAPAAPKTRAPRSRQAVAADRGAADANDVNGHDASGAGTDAMSAAELRDVPHEQIAVRAYHLYLERGGRGGDEFQDWITAERQLRERAASARAR